MCPRRRALDHGPPSAGTNVSSQLPVSASDRSVDEKRSEQQRLIEELHGLKFVELQKTAIVVCCHASMSTDGGAASVLCSLLSGQEVANLQVPPGEPPYGPWLYQALRREAGAQYYQLISPDGHLIARTSEEMTTSVSCLYSQVDRDLSRMRSFAEKAVAWEGGASVPASLGYACRKGLKPECPNQDAFFAASFGQLAVYAVFDGYGRAGHLVADFVVRTLPKLILRDDRAWAGDLEERNALLQEAYQTCQALIEHEVAKGTLDANMSGTSASIVFHDIAEQKLYVCWVGNSGVSVKLCSGATAKMLTRDHTIRDPSEKKRMEAAVATGACAADTRNRRYPGLFLSRCLGDLWGQTESGLSSVPEFVVYDIEGETLLLLCSDGVWEFISEQEAMKIVEAEGRDRAQEGVNQLVQNAWDTWIKEEGGCVVDDITVLAVFLHAAAPSSASQRL